MAYTEQQVVELINEAVEQNDLQAIERLQTELFRNADHGPTPFSAAVKLKQNVITDEPDPTEESAATLNLLNVTSRAKRKVQYQLKKIMDPSAPVIVSEGDSWFQYPIRLTDTIDHLIDSDSYAIYSLGAAGDTIEDMIKSGEYLNTIDEVDPICFLFSGGGNDLVGEGKLVKVLKKFTNQTDPSELINDKNFNLELKKVRDGIETMLTNIGNLKPNLPIIMHGYDHPHNITKGPWIWPPMKDKKINHNMALKIIAELIDRYNFKLMQLSNQYPNFFHINLTGAIKHKKSNWFDALHPTSESFKIVTKRYEQKIADARNLTTAGLSEGSSVSAHRGSANKVETIPVNEAITKTILLPAMVKPEDLKFCPENEWRQFDDPDVHKQIKEVISLLKEKNTTETPERIKNRLQFKPQYAQNRFEDLTNIEYARNLTESIISGNDLEPVQSLIEGYRVTKAIGLVQVISHFGTHTGSGSGFLVGENLFLTNNHVLQDEDEATRSFVIFDNEVSLDGSRLQTKRFRITGDVFYTSKELDFSFVSLEPLNVVGASLKDYPILPLIPPSGKAIKHEPISIIQHPGGHPKMIAHRNSYVIDRLNEGIYYTTDTKGGSSGSPVVNREWQVVALHHRTVPHPCKRGEFIANRGIRISSIFQHCFNESQRGAENAKTVLNKINRHLSGEAIFFDEAAPITTASINLDNYTFKDAPVPCANEETILDEGAYEGLTLKEFLSAIAKQDPIDDEDEARPWERALSDDDYESTDGWDETYAEALPSSRDNVMGYIGQRGLQFIVAHEVSSQSYYNRQLKNPIKPGGASGITVGIGYDLGYQKLSEFRRHWQDLLSNRDMRALERCIGAKGAGARQLLPSVRHVSISFDDAMEVFKRASLPKYFRLLNRHMSDHRLGELHPHCVAVLVSLTFNRGASYGKSAGRYREMRAIKRDVNNGRFERVPGHLRSMKRLWRGRKNLRGLLRRRDEEAQLFQRGLWAMQPQTESQLEELSDAGAYDFDDDLRNRDTDDEQINLSELSDDGFIEAFAEQVDADDSPHEESFTFEERARPRLSARDAGWVNSHINHPDYWHLPAETNGQEFDLTADVIEALIEAGHYKPVIGSHNKLIISLRGCEMVEANRFLENKTSIRLKPIKPNHFSFRCLIGVYDKRTRLISLFLGSTVPFRTGMLRYYNWKNGYGLRRWCNMLPTGCYEHCVGTHFGGSGGQNKIHFVLRLGSGPTPSSAGSATVLRTFNDLIYGTKDLWHNLAPADNIHPAFGTNRFSSIGCLTIRGSQKANSSARTATQEWARFQKAGGFAGKKRGERYDNLLTTGHEAATIAAALKNGDDLTELESLRHGSQGVAVEKMQSLLGLSVDGDFGPGTKEHLCKKQNQKLGFATGIWTKTMAESMGQVSSVSEGGAPLSFDIDDVIPDEEMTLNIGDDDEAEPEAVEHFEEAYQEIARWRVARSLLTLREQVNRLAPRRNKRSDGTIGDIDHKNRSSDHNPWVLEGRTGVVTALDITHHPRGGCDAEQLVEAIRASRDPRVKYIIWNRRICSSSVQPWQWRSYNGRNPHTRHFHVSVKSNKRAYDSTNQWEL